MRRIAWRGLDPEAVSIQFAKWGGGNMDSRATHVADRAARNGGGDHARPKSADIADPPPLLIVQSDFSQIHVNKSLFRLLSARASLCALHFHGSGIPQRSPDSLP